MIKIFTFVALLLPIQHMAQTINGKVSSTNNQPLAGATIKWAGTSNAVRSNENGTFTIVKNTATSLLVASFSGYVTDTIDVAKDTMVLFTLQSKTNLAEVVVTAEKQGTLLSNRNPI
jgi:CarboxypepD_reg-like domain